THGVILRQHIHGKIYTSTEYSPAFRIRLHNECAFANTWPAQICFFCIAAPASGGETPIADSRRVLRRISQTTLNRLNQHGVRYVRNFGYGSSRTWEKTFGTSDKETVEEICRADGVTCEWLDQPRLRTCSVRPPIVMHPVTDEAVWFNHINSSHISSLEPELRDALLKEFKKEQLPRNCYYGDGSDIEQSVLQEIQEAYDAETVAFTWQKGDLLMLDNMLVAHGRNQFTGSRKIVVGMAGAVKRDEL
ncbi:MAG: TauD/TfdA family dioxygenase, partial [Gammaproteobacteria bacterium]